MQAQDVYTFYQTDDDLGLVSIEAEHYTELIPAGGGDNVWEVTTDYADYSGDGAVMAMPVDTGFGYPDDALASSCILSYQIDFMKADTVYIWIRGWHSDGSDDSFHAGIDFKA